MTKQATPHPRLAIVSRLRWRLKLSAPAASRRIEPAVIDCSGFSGHSQRGHRAARSRSAAWASGGKPSLHYLSLRRASTGVNDDALQAGNNAERTAITVSVTNANAVVSQLTGRPGNMSGIFTSFSALESPKATAQPTSPLM